MSESTEPQEPDLPDKPPVEPLPDDVDEQPGDEDVGEATYLSPEQAASDDTVDDAEAESV